MNIASLIGKFFYTVDGGFEVVENQIESATQFGDVILINENFEVRGTAFTREGVFFDEEEAFSYAEDRAEQWRVESACDRAELICEDWR